MPAPDETGAEGTDLVAVVAAGRLLADAVMRLWDAGAAVLPLDPRLPRPELDGLLERLRPTRVGDGTVDEPFAGGLRVPHDTAAVVVTSGTTGPRKGVELTRTGMYAMGRAYSAGLDAGPADRWLACLPLHHVASLGALARAYVTGVPWTVHDGFDIARVARSPAEEGTTIVSLVPTALHRLLAARAPVHRFRRVITGGAPCPPALREHAEREGAFVVDAYGLSETWGGFALDGAPIDGAEVATREGEIVIRGAMVMRGYRRDPDGTRAVLDRDGWLHTGDAGNVDEHGRVRVVDRLKDIVITGGVNVSPSAVEDVLRQHPDVDDVCVVGVPDDEWGERVVAFVVAATGSRAPTTDTLRAFARDRLSAAQLPREVRTLDAIPRGASGKALRRVLREHS